MRVVLSDQVAPRLKLADKSFVISSPVPKSGAPVIPQVWVVAMLTAFDIVQEVEAEQ